MYIVFQNWLNNGDLSFVLEIDGTEKYNPAYNEFNWIFKLNWRPQIYIFSKTFYKLYQLANHKNGLGNDLEWPLGLSFSVLGINELVQRYEKYFTNRIIGIVSGFHKGDMMKINGFNE